MYKYTIFLHKITHILTQIDLKMHLKYIKMIQKYHHVARFKQSRYNLFCTSYSQNNALKRHINDFKRITQYNHHISIKTHSTRLQGYLYILSIITGYTDHNRLIVLLPIICSQKASYIQYKTINIISKYRHVALVYLIYKVCSYCPDHFL